MLIWFVIAYLMVSVAIGLWAATRVHNAKDFAAQSFELEHFLTRLVVALRPR